MKNLTLKLIEITIGILVILAFSGCAEEEVQTNGLVMVEVIEDFSYEYVANAKVTAYRNIDDMAFETNALGTWFTNSNGAIVLNNLSAGTYYFDVEKDNFNNWNYQFENPHYVEDGQITWATSYIGINIYGIISSAQGRSWSVTNISTDWGEDVTNDPAYSCLLDDVYLFQKSGYFSIQDGNDQCNPSTSSFREGSWSGWGIEFYLGYGDGNPEPYFYVMEHSANYFIAAGDTELGWLTLRFDLLN